MRRTISAAAVLLLALAVSAALAAPPSRGAAPAKSAVKAPLQAKELVLHGTVTSINAKKNALTVSWKVEKKVLGKVRTRTRQETVSVKPGTEIMFQGRSLTLSELKKGSVVHVTAQRIGRKVSATRIEVLSEPSAAKVAAPRPAAKPRAGK